MFEWWRNTKPVEEISHQYELIVDGEIIPVLIDNDKEDEE